MPAQGHQGPLTPNHQGTAPTHEPFLHFCYMYTPVVGSSPFLLKGHFTTTSSKHLLLESTHSCHYLLPLLVARSPSSSCLPAPTVATLQPSRYKSSDGLSDPSEMPSNSQRSARPAGNQLLPQFPASPLAISPMAFLCQPTRFRQSLMRAGSKMQSMWHKPHITCMWHAHPIDDTFGWQVPFLDCKCHENASSAAHLQFLLVRGSQDIPMDVVIFHSYLSL